MAEKPISFEVVRNSPNSLARAGIIHTPHGDIETPAFVTVGTKGTVKSLKPNDLMDLVGISSVLANTYHLYLQPGHEIVQKLGGLGTMMGFEGPTWTDSGGFQVFSLGAAFGKGVTKFAKGDIQEEVEPSALPYIYNKELAQSQGKLCIIDEDGVTFTSHIDGSMHRFTAERSIEIQHAIGADIIFAFDECTSPSADYEYQKEAMDRTHRWAKRSVLAHKRNYDALKQQGLFAVVQGGRYTDLRQESARVLTKMDVDGFGIGGSFSKDDLGDSLKAVTEILPQEKPRHLLGIGEPDDIAAGVRMGCDTFDCVQPTRLARTGTIYVHAQDGLEKLNLLKSDIQYSTEKVDQGCDCVVCSSYTKGYLAHLFRAKEMLGPHLASIHNLYTIVSFTKHIRDSLLK